MREGSNGSGANGHTDAAAPPSRLLPALWQAAPRDVAGVDAETIDVGEVVRSVGRGWRVALAGVLVGLLVAAALVVFFPPRYRSTATLLLRNANDPAGSLLARFGIGGDVAASAAGGLGNVFKSPMETELQLLGSRDVLGQVVDSLGLQVRVLRPRGLPARQVVASSDLRGAFRRARVDFRREADGRYAVDWGGRGAAEPALARPGDAISLGALGRVTLAAGALPDAFSLQVEDREDAITRLEKRLAIDKEGGEVASVDYSGPDSLAAAAVPNAIVAVYLQRRRTVDRGVNQRRFEFLTAQADSLERGLLAAEGALRSQQERSGLFDAELTGRAGAEALQEVRTQLGPSEAELVAARRVVADVEGGTTSPRQLVAFPTFLKSPAINSLSQQLSQLEIERTRLLERRTTRDPEVVALTQSIADIERQFLPLGRTYVSSLERQSAELRRQGDEIESRLAALPGQAEGNLRRQREVKRLAQTVLGVQAELIDTRLAALSEGGQVRQVDVARPPKKILFPRPLPTFAVCALLGLVGGAIAAAVLGAAGPRVHTPTDAERATGLPVLRYGAEEPLLLGASALARTLVIVPLEAADDARGLAEALRARCTARGQPVVSVLLEAVSPASPGEAVRGVEAAEADGDVQVVVAGAGGGLGDARTAAVLDPRRLVVLLARAGRTPRRALDEAASALARLGVPTLGIVLADRAGRIGGVERPRAAIADRRNGAPSGGVGRAALAERT